MTPSCTAQVWIDLLGLIPHTEGGFFRETYRSPLSIPGAALAGFSDPRAASTAIYYLLRADDRSRFHRLAADEVWHHYAGGTARIHRITPDGAYLVDLLGADPSAGARPQTLVPNGDWFGVTVEPPGEFVLVGCTTAPGFDYADFELADCAALLARFPRHAEVIRMLT